MADAILEFLLTLSLILGGILASLLFPIRGRRTQQSRHAH